MNGPAPRALLREYLRADAPARERAIMRLWVVATAGGLLACVSLAGRADSPVTGQHLQLIFGAGLAYALAVVLALGRGWFHPAVVWVDAVAELSLIGALLAVVARDRGPVFALLSPILIASCLVIVFTSLRANPGLSLFSGGLGAAQFLAVYWLWLRQPVPAELQLMFTPPLVLARAFLMLVAGVAGAVVARYLVANAEAALRAVREQDLMGKYLLHERLGSGGMAEVFRATYCPEGGFRKTVAIKRVLPARKDAERFTRMFLEEARLCAMLTHPNVVQVFDCGRYQGHFILAMEYVDGCSLARLLKEGSGPLPLALVTYVGAELAAALDYIHARVGPDGAPLRLVHRDLNPPNVLLSRIGEVKLADFGVAQVLRDRDARADEGGLFGKAHYLAPEQLRGEPFDGRADLFCLGLTLHEMLTGTRAVRGDTAQVLERPERLVGWPPSRLRPDVPPELDALVMSLLEEEPARRPTTGGAVREALLALPPALAPYPAGRRALAERVQRVAPAEGRPEPDLSTTHPPSVTEEPTRETIPVQRAG